MRSIDNDSVLDKLQNIENLKIQSDKLQLQHTQTDSEYCDFSKSLHEAQKLSSEIDTRNNELSSSMKETEQSIENLLNKIKTEKKEQNALKTKNDKKVVEKKLDGTRETGNEFDFKFIITMLLFFVVGCLTSIGKVWGFISIYHGSYQRIFNETINSSKMNFLHVIMLGCETIGFAFFTPIRKNLGYYNGLALALSLIGTGFF